MTQSFAKKNSFSSIYLGNMCRFYSVNITVDGTSDYTLTLPFDWTGGYVKVVGSTSTAQWANTAETMEREASYDSLTNVVYTESTGIYGSSSSGHVGTWLKTEDYRIIIKSATSTTIVFNSVSGVTQYLKVFVWAPYTATIQMDGSNIILSGSGAPASTPSFIGQQYLDTTAKREYRAYGTSSSADWIKVPVFTSGTVTITGGGGDVTITLPWDWSGGFLRLDISRATGDYLNSTDNSIMIRETSYIALTSTEYTANHSTYIPNTDLPGTVTKTTNSFANPKSATSTTFVLDDEGINCYIKYFVWA